jgi:NADH:ubiquinone reductase (H+-translocating)
MRPGRSIPNGKETPAIAPGALQHGDHVARGLSWPTSTERSGRCFEYFDKGSMATIGRARAIAQIRNWRFSGFFAWLLWSLVHIFFLIGYRNRFRVMAEWFWFYLTFRGVDHD